MHRAHGLVALSGAFGAALFVVACASSSPDVNTVTPPATDQKPKDAGVVVVDAAPPEQPKVCVSACTSDDECANSCPTVSTGSNCCDLDTNTCYRSAEAVCPVPVVNDGGTTSPY